MDASGSTRKTALITGAAAGLGASFADLLGGTGYDLVLVDRQGDRLSKKAAALRERHRIVTHAFVQDLTDPNAVTNVFARCESLGLRVDFLVNNAGFHLNKLFRELSWDALRANIRVLLDVVVEMSHRFLPPMIERKWGRIINVASVSGFMPGSVRLATYNGTKAFLIPFTEALNAELEGTGIHASAVCPGFMRTDLFEANGLTDVQDSVPGFMWLDPAQVAAQAVRAVERGNPVHVSGLPNQAIVTAAKFVPRWLLRERTRILHRKAHDAVASGARGTALPDRPARAALITGASSGIGASLAGVLAKEGFDLVLVARREDRLHRCATDLAQRYGVRTHAFADDLTDPRAPGRLRTRCAELGWPIEVLVNNAAYPVNELFVGMLWADIDAALQLLVRSVVELTHSFLPPMLDRRRGRIINIASMAGFEPGSYRSTLYSSSKAFVIGFSESVDAELEGTGVRVTAVCPGFTNTEWAAKAGLKQGSVPSILAMESDDVARAAFGAASRGTAVAVTSTPAQRVVTTLFRIAPRPLVRRLLSNKRKQMID